MLEDIAIGVLAKLIVQLVLEIINGIRLWQR